MSERLVMLGDRVERRQKRQRRAESCKALRDRLRMFLNPLLEPEEMDGDAILDVAALLHAELAELALVDRTLAALNRELGD